MTCTFIRMSNLKAVVWLCLGIVIDMVLLCRGPVEYDGFKES